LHAEYAIGEIELCVRYAVRNAFGEIGKVQRCAERERPPMSPVEFDCARECALKSGACFSLRIQFGLDCSHPCSLCFLSLPLLKLPRLLLSLRQSLLSALCF